MGCAGVESGSCASGVYDRPRRENIISGVSGSADSFSDVRRKSAASSFPRLSLCAMRRFFSSVWSCRSSRTSSWSLRRLRGSIPA